MAVASSQVSVGAVTAVALVSAPNVSYPTSAARIIGQSAAITNNGSATVYLGGANVAIGNGFPLAAGATITIDLGPDETLYGLASSGTQVCAVLTARG